MREDRLGRARRAVWAARLGWRDLLHEPVATVCQIAALAAIIAPLLLLFGIKTGVVRHLTDELASNVRTRQVAVLSEGSFPMDWIKAMAARPEVGFIQAHTRSLAAGVDVVALGGAGHAADDERIRFAALLASGAGDPLLPAGTAPPDRSSIVISTALRAALGVGPGDTVNLAVTRRGDGGDESVLLPLRVTGVVGAGDWDSAGALVDLGVLIAVERWRDGYAVPERGWTSGRTDTPRGDTFPNIRLYAADLASVEPLVKSLTDLGFEVRSRLAEVRVLRGLDRGLTAVFMLICAVAALGAALAFGASLWGGVARKAPAIGMMRLIGMERSVVAAFPMAQALVIAIAGAATAAGAAWGAGRVVDRLLAEGFGMGGRICRLEPEHAVWALAAAVLVSLVSSIAAVGSVVRVGPEGGLSDA